MNKIKDKKIIILFAVLLVFTIIYFLVVNKVSYAFENTVDLNSAYNKKIETIIKCAEFYGKENIESFNDEGLLYITVQTLVDNNYLVSNEKGLIPNYLNEKENLNSKKIRIKKDEDKISAEIYS